MKLKTLVAAMAIVIGAPAFAALTPPGEPTGDNTELFLVVQDSVAKVSFTLDLGVTLGGFIATEAGGSFKLDWNLGSDANWATFSSVANTSKAVWAVLALDNFGPSAVAGAHRILTTVKNGTETLPAKMTNTQLISSIGGGQGAQFFGSVNATGSHNTNENGSSVNYNTDAGFGYFGKAGGLGPKFSTAAMVNTNAIGTESALFLLSGSGGSAGKVVIANQFDTLQPVVASFDGSMLQISAVPEPGTYALMLAGLLAVGVLARRRS